MKLFDLQHPWFIPLYRRVLATALCLFWTAVEFFTIGSPFWIMLFGALSALCIYSFFIAFNPRDPN